MFKHPTVQSGYSTVFGPNTTDFYVVAAGIFIKQTKTETAQCLKTQFAANKICERISSKLKLTFKQKKQLNIFHFLK